MAQGGCFNDHQHCYAASSLKNLSCVKSLISLFINDVIHYSRIIASPELCVTPSTPDALDSMVGSPVHVFIESDLLEA